MQRILGRGKTDTKPAAGQQPRKFNFPKKERDPNAMDVDQLGLEEKEKLMKAGKCFNCRLFGHLARDCPKKKKNEEKKWDGKSAAAHIRGLIAGLSKEEKEKLEEEAETEGLGF